MIQIFGIRHHGAGSCRRLQQALAHFQPDIIALESVQECAPLLAHLRTDMQAFTPPVAMLLYNPKDFGQAIYYPFAEYSPEWQTLHYAVNNQIPVAHIDLPQSIRLQIPPEDQQAPQQIQQDPIGYLAQLAGYDDPERWWETTFEQYTDHTLFPAIADMMQAIRDSIPNSEESPLNLLREAHMRQQLRSLVKEGHQRIAVVCGAYHQPALNLDAFKPKDDSALLKPYSKIKNILQATWIPWTFARLSRSSGYGAGITAPAWYHFLYHNPQMATINWLTRVAASLRNADIDCSSAHVIEAVRLAETLCALRGLALPSLDELNEATVAVLLNGDSQKLELVIDQLIIGNKIGTIPASVPQLPLQQDIDSLIKKLRLSQYLAEPGWLKKTANKPQGGLDLREAHDREQSQFLHRLNVLNIPWGKQAQNTGREQSNKNEYWQMQWQPDFALLIIEASIWGSNLLQAASAAIIDKALHSDSLPELASLLDQALKANLPTAFEEILKQIQDAAALHKDVESLLSMLPHLVRVARYGDVRQTDTRLVNQIIEQTAPRVSILLPSACLGIQYDAALKLQKHIVSGHRALLLYQNPQLLADWNKALHSITSPELNAQPYLAGVCTRLLFDNQQLSAADTGDLMQLALSNGSRRMDAAQWIEGFLFSSGLLLVHNLELWQILNGWLDKLEVDAFIELLPILRRSFSKFSAAERQKMLARALQPQDEQPAHDEQDWDSSRAALLSPLLKNAFSPIESLPKL